MLKGFGWNATPTDIQAANGICDLFRYSLPVKNLSPLFAPTLLRVALAYLDACVFLGLNTPGVRERLTMILRVLVVHGETWALSRKMANEIKMVIMEYISMPQSPSTKLPHTTDASWATTAASLGLDGFVPNSTMTFPEFDFSLPEDHDGPPEWPVLDLQEGINV
jgi:hypothetical protein